MEKVSYCVSGNVWRPQKSRPSFDGRLFQGLAAVDYLLAGAAGAVVAGVCAGAGGGA